MNTLEQQINWLSNNITYLIFLNEMYKNSSVDLNGVYDDSEFINNIENHKQCLESLLILFERDLQCENCVNAYFDNLQNSNL